MCYNACSSQLLVRQVRTWTIPSWFDYCRPLLLVYQVYSPRTTHWPVCQVIDLVDMGLQWPLTRLFHGINLQPRATHAKCWCMLLTNPNVRWAYVTSHVLPCRKLRPCKGQTNCGLSVTGKLEQYCTGLLYKTSVWKSRSRYFTHNSSTNKSNNLESTHHATQWWWRLRVWMSKMTTFRDYSVNGSLNCWCVAPCRCIRVEHATESLVDVHVWTRYTVRCYRSLMQQFWHECLSVDWWPSQQSLKVPACWALWKVAALRGSPIRERRM